MEHEKDGIYFTAKMMSDGMTLTMTIVKNGKKEFLPMKLAPTDKETKKILNVFYEILDKATKEGAGTNRIIKYLEGGMDEFLANGK